jgi:hypothetical protein
VIIAKFQGHWEGGRTFEVYDLPFLCSINTLCIFSGFVPPCLNLSFVKGFNANTITRTRIPSLKVSEDSVGDEALSDLSAN